ncbi:unnamed protein product [Ilex paraguariensis]|uniref:Uncharacterized protein n=1 Tax=Ilex paraguariensis TaxID=185542 RepID=A0ABC8TSE5_9AQUA
MCASHGALVQDKRVHGGGSLGNMVQDSQPGKPEKMKEVVYADDMRIDVMNLESSVGYNGSRWKHFGVQQASLPDGGGSSVMIPEGRVHGGSLLSMLAGSSGLGFGSGKSIGGGPSEPEESYMMPQSIEVSYVKVCISVGFRQLSYILDKPMQSS